MAAPLLIGAVPAGVDVRVTVTDLRAPKGQVLACLTAKAEGFPDCEDDPRARTLVVPATDRTELDFRGVSAGIYAIALVHDENANGKLDKRLLVPREGFGFSRDAPVMLGPPRFASAAFEVGGTNEHQSIRMRYLF